MERVNSISDECLTSIIKSISVTADGNDEEVTLTIPAGDKEIYISVTSGNKVQSRVSLYRAGTKFGLIKEFFREGHDIIGPVHSNHVE